MSKRRKDHIAEERKVVALMIRMYCRHREGNASLCPDCAELMAYSIDRLEHCRFGAADEKPTCRKCPVHCYNPDMRDRIRKVMRWAGPRMLLYHPIAALRHLLRER